jgi:hypothetical protein
VLRLDGALLTQFPETIDIHKDIISDRVTYGYRRGGKADAESRTASNFTVTVNRPSMDFHNLANGWQSQATPPRLRGEECVEHLLLRLCGHPFTRIDDFEHDAIAARIRLKLEYPSLGHRLLCVP